MIEEILTNHLRADEALAARLARYGGAPAVFCQKAPDDTDPGWEQGRQFPRAVFLLDMAGDPQREREGTLAVDIFCLSPDAPEDLEPLMRERLNGRFFLDKGAVLSAAWRASNYFTEADAKVDGVTVLFDLVEYPLQSLPEPDPIRLLGRYLQESFPQAAVLGLTPLEGTEVTPSPEKPVFYCQLTDLGPCQKAPSTFACDWYTAVQQVYIIAGNRQAELELASRAVRELARRRRLFFPDKGPMLVEPPKVQASTSPQRRPYLTVEGHFGVLPEKRPADPLGYVGIKDRIGKEQ